MIGFRVPARTDVHRRRHGELHHQHVAVQRVAREEPEPVRGVDDGDPDQGEEHEADAQDRDDHPTLEPRLPKPCTHIQISEQFQWTCWIAAESDQNSTHLGSGFHLG